MSFPSLPKTKTTKNPNKQTKEKPYLILIFYPSRMLKNRNKNKTKKKQKKLSQDLCGNCCQTFILFEQNKHTKNLTILTIYSIIPDFSICISLNAYTLEKVLLRYFRI